MAGIELRNIKKSYVVDKKELYVLDGINLMIPQNKITVIVGRSGCGKTTLLRVAGGLEAACEGEVICDKEKRAFVFQEPRLMPWLNVWDNVGFGIKGPERDDLMAQRMQQVIRNVGLSGFEKAYPNQLSGGMQQRAALARALVYRPEFIMMDEPFAALDHFTRNQMQKELIHLQKECGVGLLFVTHSIDEALILGHKIVIIENGKIKLEFQIETKNEERNLLTEEFIQRKKNIIEHLNL